MFLQIDSVIINNYFLKIITYECKQGKTHSKIKFTLPALKEKNHNVCNMNLV